MVDRTTRNTLSTARKLSELAVAAPEVVAHRLQRMALAGPILSARDQKEFTGMVQEKQQAFVHSWTAMMGEGARAQQALFKSWLRPLPLTGLGAAQAMGKAALDWQNASLRIAAKGLAPVHSKAVANAKRLRNTKLK